MDFTEKIPLKNPYEKTWLPCKIFFCWLFPVFWRGYRRDLLLEDMYDTLHEDTSKFLGDKLETEWDNQVKKTEQKYKKPNCSGDKFTPSHKPSLLKALWGLVGWKYSLLMLLSIPESIFRIFFPLAIRQLLLCSTTGKSLIDLNAYYGFTKETIMFISAGFVVLMGFGITLSYHPTCHYGFRLSMRIRIACSSLIYRKTLRLSKYAQGQTTVGQIGNILSNDVNRFDYNMLNLPYIPLGIIQTAVFSWFLWNEFGLACLTGILLTLALGPFQYWNGKWSAKYRNQIAQRTDERCRILNEVILGMKIIKQYTWEKPFELVINKLREFEISAIRKRLYLRGFQISMFMSMFKLVIFLTILTLLLQPNPPPLTADKIYFLVQLYFEIIQISFYVMPQAISGIGEMKISLQRIQAFLLLGEKCCVDKNKITSRGDIALTTISHKQRHSSSSSANQNPQILLESVSASWTGQTTNLININFKCEGDKVVIICGPVGSGKSSLLQLLLKELPLTSGKLDIKGRLAYASQEPWLFPGNIRQNILFGRSFKEDKYSRVVKYSALEEDFKQFEFGDQTTVGERGISLSGGQKARINLARCLYQDADIFLMDDPLSAVDSRVSRQLFEEGIKKGLRGKLRILVTHQVQYLPQADHIVLLNEGKIQAQGSYKELIKSSSINLLSSPNEESFEHAITSEKSPRSPQTIDLDKLKESQDNLAEKKASGAITSRIYWEYLKMAEAPCNFVMVLFSFLFCQLAFIGFDYWLSYWTSAEEARLNNPTKLASYLLPVDKWTSMYIFSGLVTCVIIFNILRALQFFQYCMKISVNMHNRMFSSLARAPIKFYDDNPSGRILNRFTKDLGSMDETLPPAFFDTTRIFSDIFGGLILLIISNYYSIIPIVGFFGVAKILQVIYINTARDIKRIEGVTKSAIFTHTSATFQGLCTVRSAKAELILIDQFDRSQDIHTTSWFMFFSTTRCFGMWMDIVCNSFVAIVIFSFILLKDSIDGGTFGLAITAAMSITAWMQFGMRQLTEVENLMTSVERTLEYADIKPEAALDSPPDKKPPSDWPTSGLIQFSKIHLSYDSENDILKDLTFTVNPGEKIGVVGRTGAGKSTIIQCLLRLSEAHKGSIHIDGINVLEIGLHDLRRKISIIPQDPILFTGTVRYNLDPFSEYSDQQLWNALEEVELKNVVQALDYRVSDGNFSLGQRQLVCLARAILRKNKIICLDEATANVDPETDHLIQETIRRKFANCTMITIAHRLHSVIDSDRILVLDNGHLKEFDHPHKLLQNPEGYFTKMVEHTGKASRDKLHQIAKEKFCDDQSTHSSENDDEFYDD